MMRGVSLRFRVVVGWEGLVGLGGFSLGRGMCVCTRFRQKRNIGKRFGYWFGRTFSITGVFAGDGGSRFGRTFDAQKEHLADEALAPLRKGSVFLFRQPFRHGVNWTGHEFHMGSGYGFQAVPFGRWFLWFFSGFHFGNAWWRLMQGFCCVSSLDYATS